MFGLGDLFGGGGGGGSFSGGGIGNSSSTPIDSHADQSLNGGNGSILSTNDLTVGDGSVVTSIATDLGAIGSAFDFAKQADATNGEGFASLLTASSASTQQLITAQQSGFKTLVDAASGLFDQATSNATRLAGQTEQAVLSAYTNAASDRTSTIDNRTLIALAVAGVAAVFVLSRMRAKG